MLKHMLKKFKRNFKKQQISNLKAIAFKFEKNEKKFIKENLLKRMKIY